ncbi:MAG: trypsin-like peptidase domain-containing protein [Microbacterium sp.]
MPNTAAPDARPHRPRRAWIAAAVATVVVVIAGIALFALPTALSTPEASASAVPSPSPSATTPTVAEVYASVVASVVVVQVVLADGTSLGSGVVVDDAGTILTAAHVVEGASSIEVTFADGTVAAATVSATDAATDTATLVPDTLPGILVPATIGASAPVSVGSTVIAIGNPLGLSASASTGIVSGLDRTATPEGGTKLSGLIQFDAAANPGSSGGPLLDENGAVIGIVVAIANPTGDDSFAGIGFAVPLGTALEGVAAGGGPQQ